MRAFARSNTTTQVVWRALAAAAALAPGVLLPLQSYAANGYLTLNPSLLLLLFLPCASVAFLASLHEARPLWSARPREEAFVMSGLPAVALLLGTVATIYYVTGQTACYHCDFAWLFFALPSVVLEFAAGVVWLFLMWDALRDHRAPDPGTA